MTKKICAVILALIMSLAFTTVVVGEECDPIIPTLRPSTFEIPIDEVIE